MPERKYPVSQKGNVMCRSSLVKHTVVVAIVFGVLMGGPTLRAADDLVLAVKARNTAAVQIGRASCRERV